MTIIFKPTNYLKIKNNNFTCRYFSANISRINIKSKQNKNFIYNKASKNFYGLIGYISNLKYISKDVLKVSDKENLHDVDVIALLYEKKGEKIFQYLDGIFTIFLWNEEKQKGYIIQDEHGFSTPLYFIKNQGLMLFSNSLKSLLIELNKFNFNRELDIKASREFILQGNLIPNSKTLIKGIYKLIPNQKIIIDYKNNNIILKKNQKKIKKINPYEARKQLLKSIEEHTNQLCLLSKKCIGTTISSGFDSNLILYFLYKNNKEITGITIGGEKINEIPKALKCSQKYKNINHIVSQISNDKLNDFPDIVWRIEGAVFERGLFLQYETMKLIKTLGINCAFFGECADQQLDSFRTQKNLLKNKIEENLKNKRYILKLLNFYKKMTNKQTIKRIPKICNITINNDYKNYDTIKDYILKKNGILANSFAIQSFYPFLNKKTSQITHSMTYRDSKSKKFYKKEVKKMISNNISRNFVKIGGSTDIEYLCHNHTEIFYKVLHSKLTNKLFPELKNKNHLLKNPNYYNFLLHLLYLYLFHQLFVTKKYNSYLNKEEIPLQLNDFSM